MGQKFLKIFVVAIGFAYFLRRDMLLKFSILAICMAYGLTPTSIPATPILYPNFTTQILLVFLPDITRTPEALYQKDELDINSITNV